MTGLVFLIAISIVLIGLVGTIFWIWTIIDCAVNEPSEGNDKIIWIILIVVLHGLGGLLYCLVRRPERIRRYGR